ncbi:MAG: hypothetical protein FWD94_03585 [Treponema sp.]|nr:hypothetical protein [Treponema sp.]
MSAIENTEDPEEFENTEGPEDGSLEDGFFEDYLEDDTTEATGDDYGEGPEEGDLPEVKSGCGNCHSSGSSDGPLYKLRLSYSQETFYSIYRGEPLEAGTSVVVPTRYGKDIATVVGPVTCKSHVSEISCVDRVATEEDLGKAALNGPREEEAFRACKDMIERHKLDMKLVNVHYMFDELKLICFFTAETRVDFRNLVKDLNAIFKARIELRQIGARDEARVVSGIGICGRGYCCNAVSSKLKPVSIKMAKDQNLSFNSMKISGSCGRLLCCLSYEHSFYSERIRLMPHNGSRVLHDNTTWNVTDVNVITGQIRMNDSTGRMLSLPSDSFERIENRWHVKNQAREGQAQEEEA